MMTHEEFQFNAKVLGYDLKVRKGEYEAIPLIKYFLECFSDNQVHPVPDKIIVDGSLLLNENFISFPVLKLHVKGNLLMSDNKALVLPQELVVDGFMDASCSSFVKLSEKCKIGQELSLRHSKIEVLPANLNIKGTMNVIGCKNLKVLPKNLQVHKHLFINETGITEIPKCTRCKYIFKDF